MKVELYYSKQSDDLFDQLPIFSFEVLIEHLIICSEAFFS